MVHNDECSAPGDESQGAPKLNIDDRIDFRTANQFDSALIEIWTASFGVIILMVSAIVISRQIGGIRFSALNPASRYLFIVTIFFGSAIASYNETHIKIDYFLDKLGTVSLPAKYVTEIIVRVIVIAFIAIVIYGSASQGLNNLGTYPGDSQIFTLGQLYIGITVGFAITVVYEAILLKDAIVQLRAHGGG